jgi:recA bacterial DNA recombination protein
MGNKYAAKLRKLEGAITERFDPFEPSNLIRFSSPGVNWLFGKTHGMPRGFSALLWGEKKSGKSVLLYDAIGTLHRSNPNAIAIKFDTEFRDLGQLDQGMADSYGIDLDRLVVYQVNRPEHIFDRMKNEVRALIDDGAEIPLIGIDSISDILGRREAEQDSVTQHQIGDHAVTLQVGLKSIIETQRTKKIALIMIAHARDEMDPWEIKRGNKKKPAAANAVQHHCEYFINVEKNKTASGKSDILERKFIDESRKDMRDTGQQTAHKTYVFMGDSSMGPKGREVEFTFADGRGIINQHEEVFKLGLNWKVIQRPVPKKYIVAGQEFIGKPACLKALEESVELQQKVISQLIEMEKTGLSMELGTVCEDVEDE